MSNLNTTQLLEQLASVAAQLNGQTMDEANLNDYQLLERLTAEFTSYLENGAANQGGGYPAPYVAKVFPDRVISETTATIDIEGSFFTPNTTVSLTGMTVNSVTFMSDSLLQVEVTAGTDIGFFDLTLNNGQELIVTNIIEVFQSIAIDLRAGGANFSNSAIEIRNNMSWQRTPSGLTTSGSNGWSKWVRFVGDNDEWVKVRANESANLALVFQVDNGMIGWGSRETNESSTSQWREGEILGYFTSSTNFWGFYGNNGTPGTAVNQYLPTSVNNNAVLKLVIAGNGAPGQNYYLYELPSSSEGWQPSGMTEREFIAANSNVNDWYRTDNLIATGAIGGNMTADAAEIMPFLIPVNNNFNFLGFYYE